MSSNPSTFDSSNQSLHHCASKDCDKEAKFRCGKCKIVFYCCAEHQKIDWPTHKVTCNKDGKETKDNNVAVAKITSDSQGTSSIKQSKNDGEGESRICRCMFCGEEQLLKSEEEAIDHMRVCPALQEQLQSKDQFTIPSMLKEKMKNMKK